MWCCNPESQHYKTEEMLSPEGKTEIVGRDVSVGDVLADVKKDMVYYRRSGGGVTLSGGECLCQSEFAYELLKTFHANSINTAIETTLCADFGVIEKLAPYVDTFLVDIKHTNHEKHKQFTTRSNEMMMENAKKLAPIAKRMIVRVPVVPTFNATEEEIASIARFAKSLDGVEEMHLLPYHSFGSDKYARLGREYTMADIQTPSDETMERLRKAAENEGIRCQIGG